MSAQLLYPKLAALSASLPDPIGPQDCTDENRQAVECYRELMRRDGGSAQLLADMLEGLQHVEFEGNDVCLLAPEDRDEIVTALRAQGWQPIESAPKDGTPILGCNGNWRVTMHWHTIRKCWADCGPSYSNIPHDEQPKFWQSLPAPPNERAG